MGRKSKLTPDQWADIQRRVLEGASIRALAKEYKIAESTLREKISAETAQIKIVANQIVATERAVMSLPITAQITAHNLAAKLRAISDNLASAAHHGAATAHRLSALANQEVNKIDDANVLSGSSMEAMAGVSRLTVLANESSKIAVNLLNANKEHLAEVQDDKPQLQTITRRVVDAGRAGY